MDNGSSWCWAARAWQRLDKNLTLMAWEDHGLETSRHLHIYIYICVCISDIMLFWMDQNAAMLFLKHTHYLYIYMYRTMLLAILALPFAAGNSWKLSAILIGECPQMCITIYYIYRYILQKATGLGTMLGKYESTVS